DAVGELVGGGVERVARTGREVHAVVAPVGRGAAVADVHDADDRRAVAVVGVIAEGLVVVVVDAAEVLVGLVDLLVADGIVVAFAHGIVRGVAAAGGNDFAISPPPPR